MLCYAVCCAALAVTVTASSELAGYPAQVPACPPLVGMHQASSGDRPAAMTSPCVFLIANDSPCLCTRLSELHGSSLGHNKRFVTASEHLHVKTWVHCQCTKRFETSILWSLFIFIFHVATTLLAVCVPKSEKGVYLSVVPVHRLQAGNKIHGLVPRYFT